MKKRQGRVKSKSELPKLRNYGQTEFWYDQHHRRNAMVVESDDPNYPVIAVFLFKDRATKTESEARAKRLLDKIKHHKVDYRVRATRVPVWARWNRNYGTLFEKTGVKEEG